MRTRQLLSTLILVGAGSLAAQDCLPWKEGPKPTGFEAEEQARAYLRSAVRQHPDDGELHRRLGDLLFTGRCYNLALPEMERAAALGEKTAGFLLKLASTENILGAFGDAASHADAAAEGAGSPLERASAAALAAVAFASMGDRNLAISRFRQALELNPSLESCAIELAKLLDGKGLHDDGAAVLEKIAKLTPLSAEGWAELATIQTARGDTKRALVAWTAVQRLNPTFPMIAVMIAQTMLATDSPDRQAVLQILQTANAHQPEDPDLFYLEGKVLAALTRYPEAAKAFETAIHLRPLDANFYYQLGLTYRKLGRVELAQRQFDIVRHLRGESSER